MRHVWEDLKAMLRELLNPVRVDHDDSPDLAADTAARTEWVGDHKTCICWAWDPKPGPWHFGGCKNYQAKGG